jgi:sialidase-1
MRSYRGDNRHLVRRRGDGGASFGPEQPHPDLSEPTGQASIIGVQLDGRPVFLFSNPASTKRDHMTLKASLDEGD